MREQLSATLRWQLRADLSRWLMCLRSALWSRWCRRFTRRHAILNAVRRLVSVTKQLPQMRLDRTARKRIVAVSMRLDQRGIGIQLLAPDQAVILTALDNGLEAAAEAGDAGAVANTGHPRVVGQGLV